MDRIGKGERNHFLFHPAKTMTMLELIKKLLLTLILLQFINSYAHRPRIEFTRLTVQDGLSQSWVISIYQDKYGFMWFGTNEGLNKYDGYNFTVYKNNTEDKSTISNNGISSIYEDTKGNLWIGTENGVNLYDRNKDRFIYLNSLSHKVIVDFLELENGKIFIVSRNKGLYLYDLAKDSVTSSWTGEKDNLSSDDLSDICTDDNGNIWVASANGLNLLISKSDTFISFKNKKNSNSTIADNNIESLYIDGENRMWVGTHGGLSLLKFNEKNPEKSHFINYKHDINKENSIGEGAIMALIEDKNGYLWIGIENGGLDILDLKNFKETNPTFYHFRHDPDDNSTLSHNSIYTIYKDNIGSVWVGTYGNGLNMYNKLLKKFEHYKQRANHPNSLSNNYVNAILEEGNHLWLGTDYGLNLFDKKNEKFIHFTHDPRDSKSLGSNSVCALEIDSKGNLWVGTWAGGLNLLNREKSTFTRFENNPNDTTSIGSNNMFAILEDHSGNLWIGTMGGGLNLFDYRTKTFKRYTFDPEDKYSISDDWVRTLFESSYGEIWLSSSMAVELFEKENEKFIHFSHDRKDPESISYDGTNMFFEDSKRNLWIGTIGGLNVFNREDSTFDHYQQKDGLPNNQINGILEDDHGNLWISTNKGISKFLNGINRPANPTFINYDVGDGLQGNEFRPRSLCKGEGGKMYFGGTNGFNVFHPDSIKANPKTPPIVITGLLLFNKDVPIGTKDSPLKKHISVADQITLSYKHSVITFEYAALNFIAPEKNQYAYMLEGFDKDWNYVGNKREATYTNLNPGNYVFRVKGSNNDGVWNEKGASLRIIITPPFWQTIWFRLIMIALIILAIYSIYLVRVRNIVAYGRKLERKVAERTKDLESFAYITSHDLKAPLRGINQLAEWLYEDYGDKLDNEGKESLKMLQQRSTRMDDMIQGILEYSKIGRTEEEKENIDLNKLLDEVIDLLAPPDNVKIIVENELPEYRMGRTRMIQLFQNLLSNAIKHAGKPQGIVKVKCEEKPKEWLFSVSDNGQGIEKKYWDKIFKIFQTLDPSPKDRSTGIGLTIVKKIVDLYRGKIWVESEMGKGTTFHFTLPKQ